MIPANPNPSLGWHCLPYNPKATPITMDTYMKRPCPKVSQREGWPKAPRIAANKMLTRTGRDQSQKAARQCSSAPVPLELYQDRGLTRMRWTDWA